MVPVDTLIRAVEDARVEACTSGLPQFVQLVDPGQPRAARTLVVDAAGVRLDTGWQTNVAHRIALLVS